jgi:hypothetical protein
MEFWKRHSARSLTSYGLAVAGVLAAGYYFEIKPASDDCSKTNRKI